MIEIQFLLLFPSCSSCAWWCGSAHSRSSQSDEIIFIHPQFAAINFLIMLADQRRGARNPPGRLAEPRHGTELQVFADNGMFHVDECLAGLYLRAVHELADGVDGRTREAALLAFLVEFFCGVTATEFRDRTDHNLWIFAPICHLLELRSRKRGRSTHPIH